MRKHKWRRRLFLLVVFVVVGVIVLTPDRIKEIHTEDTTVSETSDNGTKDEVDDGQEALEGFIDQAKEKYQTYSTDFVEEANEAINEAVEGAVTSALRSFMDNIRQAAGDFFKNLIPE